MGPTRESRCCVVSWPGDGVCCGGRSPGSHPRQHESSRPASNQTRREPLGKRGSAPSVAVSALADSDYPTATTGFPFRAWPVAQLLQMRRAATGPRAARCWQAPAATAAGPGGRTPPCTVTEATLTWPCPNAGYARHPGSSAPARCRYRRAALGLRPSTRIVGEPQKLHWSTASGVSTFASVTTDSSSNGSGAGPYGFHHTGRSSTKGAGQPLPRRLSRAVSEILGSATLVAGRDRTAMMTGFSASARR